MSLIIGGPKCLVRDRSRITIDHYKRRPKRSVLMNLVCCVESNSVSHPRKCNNNCIVSNRSVAPLYWIPFHFTADWTEPSTTYTNNVVAVLELGIFLRALRTAFTLLRAADYTAPCPKKKKKKKKNQLLFFCTKCNCCFCVFRQGCKNACKMLADLCPCFHRSPTKLCPDLVSFMCWIATEFWSFAL